MTTGTYLLRFVGTSAEVPLASMPSLAKRYEANAFAIVKDITPYDTAVFLYLTDPSEGDASIAISEQPKDGFTRYIGYIVEAGDPAFYEEGEIYYYDRSLRTFYRLLPDENGTPSEDEFVVYIRKGCDIMQTFFYLKEVASVEDVITKDLCEILQREHNADAIWAFTVDCKGFQIHACYKERKKGTGSVPAFFLLHNTETGDAFYAKDINPEEEDLLFYKGVLHKLSSDFITDKE